LGSESSNPFMLEDLPPDEEIASVPSARKCAEKLGPLDIDSLGKWSDQSTTQGGRLDPGETLHVADGDPANASDPNERNSEAGACRQEKLRSNLAQDSPRQNAVPDQVWDITAVWAERKVDLLSFQERPGIALLESNPGAGVLGPSGLQRDELEKVAAGRADEEEFRTAIATCSASTT
jgi:hypothetical protein